LAGHDTNKGHRAEQRKSKGRTLCFQLLYLVYDVQEKGERAGRGGGGGGAMDGWLQAQGPVAADFGMACVHTNDPSHNEEMRGRCRSSLVQWRERIAPTQTTPHSCERNDRGSHRLSLTLTAACGRPGHIEHHRGTALASLETRPKLGTRLPHSHRRATTLAASAGLPGQMAHQTALDREEPAGPYTGRRAPHSHRLCLPPPRVAAVLESPSAGAADAAGTATPATDAFSSATNTSAGSSAGARAETGAPSSSSSAVWRVFVAFTTSSAAAPALFFLVIPRQLVERALEQAIGVTLRQARAS